MQYLAPAARHNWPDPATTGAPAPQLRDPAAAWAWLDAELASLTAVAAHTARDGWPGHAFRLVPAIPAAWVAPSAGRPLRALLRHRVSLDQLGTELRNRIHAVTAGHAGPELPAASREIVSDCLAVIENLEPLISQLDGELHQHATADPRVRMLTSLPGVAEFTALVMLTAITPSASRGRARHRCAGLLPGSPDGKKLPGLHRNICRHRRAPREEDRHRRHRPQTARPRLSPAGRAQTGQPP